jgi:hypothetical protein
MAAHAPRFSLLDLPRVARSTWPLLGLAVVALVLAADPQLRLAGAAAAVCFAAAAAARASRARIELRGVRRAVDRLILADARGFEGSELVRWRMRELVAPGSRNALAKEVARTLHGLDPARLPSASPLRRVAGRREEEMLQKLEVRLLDGRPVTARGVLLSEWLLRDPASPLYDETHEAELSRAVTRVLAELEP